jgi:hypothetical protein
MLITANFEWLQKPWQETDALPLRVDLFNSNDLENVPAKYEFRQNTCATHMQFEANTEAKKAEEFVCLDVLVPYLTSDADDLPNYTHASSVKIDVFLLMKERGAQAVMWNMFHIKTAMGEFRMRIVNICASRNENANNNTKTSIIGHSTTNSDITLDKSLEVLRAFIDTEKNSIESLTPSFDFLKTVRMTVDRTSLGPLPGIFFLNEPVYVPAKFPETAKIDRYLAILYATLQKHSFTLKEFDAMYCEMYTNPVSAMWVQRMVGDMAAMYPTSLIYMEDVLKTGSSRRMWKATETMESVTITNCGDCEDLDKEAAIWFWQLGDLSHDTILEYTQTQPFAKFVGYLKDYAAMWQAGICLCTVNSPQAGKQSSSSDPYEQQYFIPGNSNQCAHMCCMCIPLCDFEKKTGATACDSGAKELPPGTQRLMWVECTGASDVIKGWSARRALNKSRGYTHYGLESLLALRHSLSASIRINIDSVNEDLNKIYDDGSFYRNMVRFFTLDRAKVPEGYTFMNCDTKKYGVEFQKSFQPDNYYMAPHAKMGPEEIKACGMVSKLFNRARYIAPPDMSKIDPPVQRKLTGSVEPLFIYTIQEIIDRKDPKWEALCQKYAHFSSPIGGNRTFNVINATKPL